jgi:murein DD-endopeptidase MepM/ murein hydrolase activator NlpD
VLSPLFSFIKNIADVTSKHRCSIRFSRQQHSSQQYSFKRRRRFIRQIKICLVFWLLTNSGHLSWSQTSYSVRPGDTLYEIAGRYGVSVGALQQANALASNTIAVGQQLRIPTRTSTSASSQTSRSSTPGIELYQVRSGETLESILQRYGISRAVLEHLNPSVRGQTGLAPNTRLRMPTRAGQLTQLPAGQDILSFAVSHNISVSELLAINGLRRVSDVQAGSTLFVPGLASTLTSPTPTSSTQVHITPSASAATSVATSPANNVIAQQQTSSLQASAIPATNALDRREQLRTQHLGVLANAVAHLRTYQPPAPAQGFLWPTALRGRISSPFGPRRLAITRSTFHAGMDIAVPTGTAILASKDGVVSRSGWVGSYGYAVYLDHADGTQTRYAHMSRILVPAGTRVRQGDRIGLVGSTGLSTGPHLHFELRFAGRAVNPALYLR